MRKLDDVYNDLLSLSTRLEHYELDSLTNEIKNHILAMDEKRAAKDWKKATGDVRCGSITVSIDVYFNTKYPGVMIHRNTDADGRLLKGWCIRLNGKPYSTMPKAVKAFTEHLAIVNWDRPGEELKPDKDAHKAVVRLNNAK